MPYNSVNELPSAVKKLPEKRQHQWMAVWNSAYNSCKEKGGGAECEQSAFAQAWGVVKKEEGEEEAALSYEEFVKACKPEETKKEVCPTCGKEHPIGPCPAPEAGDEAAAKKAAEDLEKDTAAINDLPDSAFAYIEPGGEKDSSGRTVPRSLRHFPIHDEAHVRNALARLNQSPFGDKAKSKILAAAHRMGIKLDPARWKKAADESLDLVIKILNTSAPQGLFYGVVYSPGEVDTQGDFTSADEIEKAAHDFLPNAVMNIHHSQDLQDVQVVESYIAPVDFNIDGQTIRKGSWVLVTRVLNEALKDAILKGEITGYSLEGTAARMEW